MKAIAKILGLDESATEEQILEALTGKLDTSAIAKALELKDDATSQEILDAIKAKDETDEVSLEDQAKAEGKVVLSANEVSDLKAGAAAGKAAAAELKQNKFDSAFEKALDEVRVDAKDETKDRWQKLYDADAETALATLAELPKLANTKPRGGSGDGGSGDAPEGVDQEHFELNEKVEARAAKDDCSYEEALRKVRAEEKS